ncbi:hypothetical protein E3N88_33444 [Mikania micrantha]|uniref:Uncharacterized protein n=1 Tax=Mikania micrantha TaxID=192012 RepID=A0A5N6MC13_9ASTR|nr:hypothetical protein E3N88_33444 [Mikania micrantha]
MKYMFVCMSVAAREATKAGGHRKSWWSTGGRRRAAGQGAQLVVDFDRFVAEATEEPNGGKWGINGGKRAPENLSLREVPNTTSPISAFEFVLPTFEINLPWNRHLKPRADES